MREIKFRMLSNTRNDDNVFTFEYFTLPLDLGLRNECYLNEDFYKAETLSQFTGLKDKNGKEIYEGDILEFSDKAEWYRNDLFLKTRDKQVEILNDNIKYPTERRIASLDWDSKYYEWLYPCDDLDSYWEVIGNIFENPELINHPLT